MTTLIAVYNNSGCVGRCDARCHDAKGEVCGCICQGLNHGVGERQAIENTREHLEELAGNDVTVNRDAVCQMELPGLGGL